MTFLLILTLSTGTVERRFPDAASCNEAVRLAPVAAAQYGAGTRLISAKCERDA